MIRLNVVARDEGAVPGHGAVITTADKPGLHSASQKGIIRKNANVIMGKTDSGRRIHA
jgi:hypothetical protein